MWTSGAGLEPFEAKVSGIPTGCVSVMNGDGAGYGGADAERSGLRGVWPRCWSPCSGPTRVECRRGGRPVADGGLPSFDGGRTGADSGFRFHRGPGDRRLGGVVARPLRRGA